MTEPHILAYIAGFFDGEGCVMIGVSHHTGTKNPQASLSVEVMQTDIRPIDLLYKEFPSDRSRKPRKHSMHWKYKRVYAWGLCGERAYLFCKYILPFSIVKREQLELAIKFYELPWRNPRARRGGKWSHRTQEQVAIDIDFARQMKEAKHNAISH